MEIHMQFTFRNKLSDCSIYIDSNESPCYVFAILEDPVLIKLFGSDITLKTDFEKLLPKQDDYPELVELRQSLFKALHTRSEFLGVTEKLKNLQKDKIRAE